MEKLRELESKVIDWATDRNFFGEGGATLFSQYLKLREEFGELSGNFAKGKCMKDDIGDCAVVLINMNRLCGGEPLLLNKGVLEYDVIKNAFDSMDTSSIDAFLNFDSCIGKLRDSIDENDFDDFSDDIASCLVLLKYFSYKNGYDFTECLEHSYNEIKDRKGKMINNVFVKESDIIEMGSNEVEVEQQKISPVEQSETISSIIEELMYGHIKAKGEKPTLLIMNTELLMKLYDENFTKELFAKELTLYFRGVEIELNLEMEQGVILLR